MPIEQITPQQAHDLIQADPAITFVDVRTPGEFAGGHPAGAINIPILFADPNGMSRPNPDFIAVVEALLPMDSTVILTCLAGGRSQSAAEKLAQAGYDHLSNMQGGWGGGAGGSGWQAHGLPVSHETGSGVGYDSLKAKAGVA